MLGLHVITAEEGLGLIPGWGNKIPQAACSSKKKKKVVQPVKIVRKKRDSGEVRKMREMRKYDTMYVWNTLDKLLRLTEPQFPIL